MLRARWLGLVLALAGAALLASLWMPFYRAVDEGAGGFFVISWGGTGNPLSAWNEFGQIDWVLAALGACAIALGIRPVIWDRRPSASVVLRALVAGLVGIALVAYRLADATLDGGHIVGLDLKWTAGAGAAVALVSLCAMIAALAGLARGDLEPQRPLQLDDPRGGLGDAGPEPR